MIVDNSRYSVAIRYIFKRLEDGDRALEKNSAGIYEILESV
jgi:hypothetical protein